MGLDTSKVKDMLDAPGMRSDGIIINVSPVELVIQRLHGEFFRTLQVTKICTI